MAILRFISTGFGGDSLCVWKENSQPSRLRWRVEFYEGCTRCPIFPGDPERLQSCFETDDPSGILALCINREYADRGGCFANGRETVPAMIGGNDFFGGVQYLEKWVHKNHFGFPQKPENKYLRGGISLPPTS